MKSVELHVDAVGDTGEVRIRPVDAVPGRDRASCNACAARHGVTKKTDLHRILGCQPQGVGLLSSSRDMSECTAQQRTHTSRLRSAKTEHEGRSGDAATLRLCDATLDTKIAVYLV